MTVSDAEAQVIRAEGNAQSRKTEGYNWADEQIAEITKIYASNSQMFENPANMIAQTPMVMAFGNMMSENMEPVLENSFSNPGLNFHNNSNMTRTEAEQEPIEDESIEDFERRMKKLKIMRDTEIITEEEFKIAKEQIKNSIIERTR